MAAAGGQYRISTTSNLTKYDIVLTPPPSEGDIDNAYYEASDTPSVVLEVIPKDGYEVESIVCDCSYLSYQQLSATKVKFTITDDVYLLGGNANVTVNVVESVPDYNDLTTFLTDVSDAIREQENSTAPIDANRIPARIKKIIKVGTSDTTAVASDILSGKTAYVNGEKVTGTMGIAGKNWNTSSFHSSGNWCSIAYGKGKFVAIANNSDKAICLTSENSYLNAWLPSSDNWIFVTYGGGRFVAIANSSNKAAYSSDGSTWIASTLPSSDAWISVAYGKGKFVAIASNSNKAAYSIDGIAWTATTLPSTSNWSAIAYGGGRFVAVTSESTNAGYSLDGVTWSSATITSNTWSSVVYGEGEFVAVAKDSNKTARSSNGTSWSVTSYFLSKKWCSIVYGEGKYVALASSSNTVAYGPHRVWSFPTLPLTSSWTSIAYGNGMFICISKDGIFAYSETPS